MDGSLVWSNQHHQSGTLMPSGAVHTIFARSTCDEAIHTSLLMDGLLRFARNDGEDEGSPLTTAACPITAGLRSSAVSSPRWKRRSRPGWHRLRGSSRYPRGD